MFRQSVTATLAVMMLASAAFAAGGARPEARDKAEKTREDKDVTGRSTGDKIADSKVTAADTKANSYAQDAIDAATEALKATKAARATPAEIARAEKRLELVKAFRTAFNQRNENGLSKAGITKEADAIKMIHDLMKKEGKTLEQAVDLTVEKLKIKEDAAIECGKAA